MKHITKLKQLFSGVLSAVMTVSAVPIVSVHAEENSEPYPYTLFASSSDDGAITVNADNFSVNGNVATNGTIISGGNVNVNGTKTESAEESMIFIFDKIDNQYFSNSNVDEHDEDYILDEMNININVPTEVQGKTTLTGNININNALKALEDVNLYGEVKNTNDSVIFSKYGDIVIDSQNVNLNGLVYAPFGSVTINAQNLNLNNVVIIAESIVLTCPSVNANNSSNASSFVGTTSEPLDIPYDEWQYMKDENENDFPDFFENYENWLLLKDTDGDMLPDCVEQFLGTDSNLTDTDGDMLDDYYEVFVTGTDPTLTDTDSNGIADGEEDFDIDGLTNYQEYVQGTSPWNNDSDNDNLSDGDEVNNYGTNPLEPDTDFDGLNDADEIALGTNPNLPDTDGNGIIDSEEKFEQTYVYDVENEDCAVEQVIVSMEGTGNLQSTMSVENIMDKDVICSGVVGLVGVPFSIETTSDFETATLSFRIDNSKLGDTDFNNLLFLWYDEDNYQFVELETSYDEINSLVSIETTHFSRYMVVDKNKWFEAWAVDFNYNPAEKDSHAPTFKYNTVLAIDCSGSMDGNDKISTNSGIDSPYEALFPKTCQRIEAATQFIKNMNSSDKAAVVLFTSNANTVQSMTSNQEDLKLSLQNITSSGGTDFYSALTKSYNTFEESSFSTSYTNNRIILLSDGEDGSYNSTLSLLHSIYDKDSTDKRKSIKIYTIGLGTSYDSRLEEIADISHGEFFKARTADELVDIYTEIGIGGDFDDTDTDGDKLYDAVEAAGIRIQNGMILRNNPETDTFFSNPSVPDTDNDGLTDGQEIDPTIRWRTDSSGKREYYFFMYSDPSCNDSDGDGINDYDETMGVTFTTPEGVNNEYQGEPLKKGLANGIVGKLTIVSHDPKGVGHAFLLYESYINDNLDLSGLAAGFKYIENDGDDNSLNNWKKIKACEYKISPNRYISIGNFVDGAGTGSGTSSGSSGSSSSGSSSQSGSSGSSQSGSSGGSSIGSSQSSASGDASDASAGTHFNIELCLLYSDYEDSDDNFDRGYKDNYALDHDISEDQLKKCIEYWNSGQHYNFVSNNCAEIASKTWEKAFGEHINGRMFLGVYTPNPLKRNIKKHDNSYVIDFRSDKWTQALNKEVVNW